MNQYRTTRTKFVWGQVVGVFWLVFSIFLGWPWVSTLAAQLGSGPFAWFFAVFAVAGIAWVPGYLVTVMVVSVLQDDPPPIDDWSPEVPVTVIIAAYNEEASIGNTLKFLHESVYEGPMRIILADNNSSDATVEVARATAASLGFVLDVIHETRQGKAHALNTAFATVTTDVW